MMTAFWIFAGFAFVFGAIIGSFLNVVIHRVPRGQSLVSPPSRCPECDRDIRWYDNVPLLSWIALGGRCRDCGASIPFRYFFVELLMAGCALALWWKVAAPRFAAATSPDQLPVEALVVPFFPYFVFVALLIVIAFVDLDHYIVPHAFTLPGIGLGLATPWLIRWLVPGSSLTVLGNLQGFWPPVTPIDSLVGLVAGALSVLALYFGYLSLRGIEGLGGGDVTLMALVGTWLGWPALLFVFFAASIQGLVAALVARLVGSDWLQTSEEIFADDPESPTVVERSEMERTDEERMDEEPAEPRGTDKLAVPFGPFIALAALEHFFLGTLLPTPISLSYLY